MTDETSTPINSDLVGDAAVLAAIAGTVEQPPSSTSPPPVDNAHVETGAELFDHRAIGLGLTEQELVDAGIMEAPAEPAKSWQACNGPDITAMIKATTAGFVRTPGFTREDVFAFLASKGL